MRNTAIALSALIFSLLMLTGVVLLFAWRPDTEDHQRITKSDYEQRLRDLAGPTAFSYGERLVPALTGAPPSSCLSNAISSGRPFFASLQFHPYGNSDPFFVGLARDAQGKLWQLSFDPERTGVSGEHRKAWLSTDSCRSFEIPRVVWRPGFCGNGR